MNRERRLELQEANLDALLRNGAFEFIDENTPWFPYTSGQVGPYYVQSIAVEKEGQAYAFAVDSMAELIRSGFPEFDAISGGETRDWDFSNPVAVALRKPHVKLYKNGKMLGAGIRGRRLLHVADLNNEGSSVRDYWKPMVEKAGGALAGVAFFVDRMEEGTAVMRDLGLRSEAVVPLDDAAWGFALAKKRVSPALHESLVKRSRDPRAWAVRALLGHPGYFRAFASGAGNREKALKILRTYPEAQGALEPLADAHGAGGTIIQGAV